MNRPDACQRKLVLILPARKLLPVASVLTAAAAERERELEREADLDSDWAAEAEEYLAREVACAADETE